MDEQISQHEISFSNVNGCLQSIFLKLSTVSKHYFIDQIVTNAQMSNLPQVAVIQNQQYLACSNGQQVAYPIVNGGYATYSAQPSMDMNTYYIPGQTGSVSNAFVACPDVNNKNEDPQHLLNNGLEMNMNKNLCVASNQQTKEPSRRRMQNTLVGRLADFMRQMARPVTIEECIHAIGDSFSELRKADGTKYKGDHFKAINGALFSTGIFRRHEDNRWVLRPEEIHAYEQRMQQKFEDKLKRKASSDDSSSYPVPQSKKRRCTPKKTKKDAILHMVNHLVDVYKQDPDTNANYLKNPFKGITGDEDVTRLKKKLGDDKYEFMIQIFHFFENKFPSSCSSKNTINTNNNSSSFGGLGVSSTNISPASSTTNKYTNNTNTYSMDGLIYTCNTPSTSISRSDIYTPVSYLPEQEIESFKPEGSMVAYDSVHALHSNRILPIHNNAMNNSNSSSSNICRNTCIENYRERSYSISSNIMNIMNTSLYSNASTNNNTIMNTNNNSIHNNSSLEMNTDSFGNEKNTISQVVTMTNTPNLRAASIPAGMISPTSSSVYSNGIPSSGSDEDNDVEEYYSGISTPGMLLPSTSPCSSQDVEDIRQQLRSIQQKLSLLEQCGDYNNRNYF
ncbi:hypothetical protein WA158_006054 [Blastocystis sp. Blastoise]